MRVAASIGETWVTTGDRMGSGTTDAATGASIVAGPIARLAATCASIGRDPATIGKLVHLGPELDAGLASPEQFRDAAGRYADVGVTDLAIPWPRAEPPFGADPPTFQ